MNNVLLFLEAALPWILIGTFVALMAAGKNAASDMKKLELATLACGIFVSGMNFMQGDMNEGSTWMVLTIAIFFIFLYRGKKVSDKEEAEIDR